MKITSAIVLVIVFISGIVYGLRVEPTKPALAQEDCQYPVRPLNPDGSCDNSDPCDPTTIKDPVLHGDCKDSMPDKELAEPKKATPTRKPANNHKQSPACNN